MDLKNKVSNKRLQGWRHLGGKLREQGAESLSDKELLSILISTGIKGKSARIPSPFEKTAHKTERTSVVILMHWMRGIIKNKILGLGLPDVETISADEKYPDLLIYESLKSKRFFV
jgi:hypothetical protein